MSSSDLTVKLIADPSSYERGMAKAGQTAETTGQKLSNFGKVAIAGLAVAALGAVKAFVGDSVRAFSELEQSIGSVESVFGDSADSIVDKSRTAATEFGLSAAEFNQSAATIGSQLKNVLGLSADEAGVKVEELIGRASDMAATFGGTTSEAISAISSLLRNERDPIEKYGVSMNDAALKAQALKMGLDPLNSKDKGLAALDLLFQQTTDSAGQFAREADTLAGAQQRANAKMENAKALIGQALSPAMKDATDLTGLFSDAVADLALNMLVAQGQITAGEASVRAWEMANGKAIETTEEWADSLHRVGVELDRISGGKGGFVDTAASIDDFSEAMEDSLNTSGLTIDQAKKMRAEIDSVGRAHDWSREQIKAAKEELDQYIKRQEAAERPISDNERALYGMTDAVNEAAGATEEHTDSIESNIDALQKRADKIRALSDPMFALTEADRELAEATDATTKAVEEYGEGTPEHLAALADQREAALDYKQAQRDLAAQGGLTKDQMIAHLRSLGTFTAQEIDRIIADMERVNAFNFKPKYIDIYDRDHGRNRPTVGGGGGGEQERASGGMVDTGVSYLVGERGPELFTPHESGVIAPASKTGMGGGDIYHITVQAGIGDPQAIAKAIDEMLAMRRRRKGGRLDSD